MRTPHAQYDDVTGSAAADWHDGIGLQKLAQAAGIDTGRYFTVGLRLVGTDLAVSEIYTVDIDTAGGVNTGEAVGASLRRGVPVRAVAFPVRGANLAITRFMKRLDVVLSSKDIPVEGIEFEEADPPLRG